MTASAPLPSTQTNTTPLAVPPREACRLLSLSMTKIYSLMRSGELNSYSDGRARRIPMQSIHIYMARHLAGADNGDTRWQGAPPIRRGWQRASGG